MIFFVCFFLPNFNAVCCVQVLQWLIVHADTIQSLLRCQELSMGTLQELSLLTGIISKTALPGALEVGGEVHHAALLEFQGHINRFQVRFTSGVPACV